MHHAKYFFTGGISILRKKKKKKKKKKMKSVSVMSCLIVTTVLSLDCVSVQCIFLENTQA